MDRYSIKQKVCKNCNKNKPSDNFYKQGKSVDGLQYWCKECQDSRTREKRTTGFYREHDLKKKFGITIDDYQEMFNKQNGLCAICNNKEMTINHKTKELQNLAVDHCHESGNIRGLLCSNCNNGLGRFKDNIEYLKNAISYLEVEPTNATNNDIWVDTA